ncbi:MAG: TonB-dependent receptor [Myxococcota bacterium]
MWLWFPLVASAQDDVYEVTVIGDDPHAVEAVPGSAYVVTPEDLARRQVLSGNEALSGVPGVTVQDEDPIGLRQNIGIRGLNPNRSRKVLVLEDGMPIALAPYGEPEMYYTPPIQRMDRIEIVKGSGSILFGPQTIGGVVNYVTAPPPAELAVKVHGRAGTWGYVEGYGQVGDRVGDAGYLVSILHQAFRGPRDLDLVRTDVTGKLQLAFRDDHALVAKVDVYDEQSAATYLGLTTPQFEADPNLSLAIHDRFDIRRYALGVTHVLGLGPSATLETRLYAHDITRNWRRQDWDREDLGEDYPRVVDGDGDVVPAADAPSDGSSIFFRDTSGHRNRRFQVAGLEPRIVVDGATGPVGHLLQVGFRVHGEYTDDQYLEGAFPRAESGALLDDQLRWGTAIAAYALDRIGLARDRIQLSPGVRVEQLWTRLDQVRVDGVDLQPSIVDRSSVHGVLPGLGIAVHPTDETTVFGGIHRGWAPPRTKDALIDGGGTLELEAEHSWNSELGLRLVHGDALYAEAALFRLDFQNQVIDPAESAGAVASGGIVQGGATLHQGFELGLRLDPLDGGTWALPLSVSYTYVHAEFRDGWGAALLGQTLPYAPPHELQVGVGLERGEWLATRVTGTYVSSQYADAVETVEPSIDGTIGLLPARFVADATVSVREPHTGLRVVVAAKNLTDEIYIASRTPRGIQPGLRRHVFGGLEWDW